MMIVSAVTSILYSYYTCHYAAAGLQLRENMMRSKPTNTLISLLFSLFWNNRDSLGLSSFAASCRVAGGYLPFDALRAACSLLIQARTKSLLKRNRVGGRSRALSMCCVSSRERVNIFFKCVCATLFTLRTNHGAQSIQQQPQHESKKDK